MDDVKGTVLKKGIRYKMTGAELPEFCAVCGMVRDTDPHKGFVFVRAFDDIIPPHGFIPAKVKSNASR